MLNDPDCPYSCMNKGFAFLITKTSSDKSISWLPKQVSGQGKIRKEYKTKICCAII